MTSAPPARPSATTSPTATSAKGLIFDAVRVRLIEIGEAVKALDPGLLATEPDIPWREIAAIHDRLAHRYFDTSHAVLASTIQHDLPQLEAAVERLTAAAISDDGS